MRQFDVLELVDRTNTSTFNNKKTVCKNMLNCIKRFIIEHTLPFKEIEYFHPNGNKMPNGIYYQRGNFCQKCRENEHSFSIYNDQGNNTALYKGFMIVFPTNSDITFPIRKYHFGNFFDGKYIGADEDQYDKRSTCVYIDDKSLWQSLKYAICIAFENKIHHVIVKDLKTNRIYRGYTATTIFTINTYPKTCETTHSTKMFQI